MIVESSFKNAWWLPGAHLQTLYPYLFRQRPNIQLQSQRLELADGDFVDLCWNNISTGPIVIIFHGLEGSIHSPYAAGLMSRLEASGFRCVLMHFRGCSGEANRLDRSYHSGDTGDIKFVIDYLSQNYPDTEIFTVGFSLGGNALLKYLGENKNATPVSAAIAISVPYSLYDCALKLSSGFSRVYQRWLIRSLKQKLRQKYSHKPSPVNLATLNDLNTFYTFDDKITAPLNNFKNADDYYAKSSSKHYLADISVPTLLIHALNDPFMTPNVIPYENELSPSIQLELADKGGHVGFISGKVPWQAEYWLENRIIEFITSQIP